MEFLLPILSVNSFFGEWSGWLPMCILAVMIAIIIHSLILMFARGFNMVELERYAQSEILQAAATALMAIFLVGMVTGIADFSVSLLGSESTVLCSGEAKNIVTSGQNETVFRNALDIVRCRVQEKAVAIADVQDRLTTGADVWGKFTALNLGLSLFGVTFFKGDWVGSLYQETETIRITNNLATVLLVGMNAVSFFALYVKNTMLSLFIPIGILLRSFHFTRGAGALFLGIGIGLYFLFPVFYILLDPGFVKVDTPPDVSGGISLLQRTVCYPTMSAAITMVNTNAQSSSAAGLSAGRLRDNLALAYVALILHPMVALFLTLAFVRYIMVIFGGDTYALMRMVSKVI